MSAEATFQDDPTPGAWLVEKLAPWPEKDGTVRVRSLVPDGFKSYARILHPFDQYAGRSRVRWAEVAEVNGKKIHAEVEWHRLVDAIDPRARLPLDINGPRSGNLEPEDCAALASLLTRFTSTPDACWFGLWAGYGDWDPRVAQFDPRLLRLTHREYLLYRGQVPAASSLRGAMQRFQSPNLWWPEDRSWCVASEIDLFSTHVAGSSACIDAILSDDTLEAVRSRPDARIDWMADTVN